MNAEPLPGRATVTLPQPANRLGLGIAEKGADVDGFAVAVDAAVGEDEGRAFAARHVVEGGGGFLGDGAVGVEGHEHEVLAVRGLRGGDEGFDVGHGVDDLGDAVGAGGGAADELVGG